MLTKINFPLNPSQLHAANVSNETSESQPEADQQCDHLDQEDEEAQRELVQIRGLPKKKLSHMVTRSILLPLVKAKHP